MLGGHVGPWTFDAAKGARARAAGRRHGPRAGRLAPGLDQRAHAAGRRRRRRGRARRAPHRLYRWRRDDPDNPYLGFLALADRIVVTSDSMSMLVEATATGKPVFVFDLADPRG